MLLSVLGYSTCVTSTFYHGKRYSRMPIYVISQFYSFFFKSFGTCSLDGGEEEDYDDFDADNTNTRD